MNEEGGEHTAHFALFKPRDLVHYTAHLMATYIACEFFARRYWVSSSTDPNGDLFFRNLKFLWPRDLVYRKPSL